MRRLAFLALLAGCSVVDDPYPLAWDPLPVPSRDCKPFEGTYADRGEAPDQVARRSLTRELFGDDSHWEKAQSVRIAHPSPDLVEVTVNGEPTTTHRFTAKSGDFRCEAGKLILRKVRWVASDLMSGRESVTVELYDAEPYLVARVQERVSGVMFIVVPLSGESARWFRFRRLGP